MCALTNCRSGPREEWKSFQVVSPQTKNWFSQDLPSCISLVLQTSEQGIHLLCDESVHYRHSLPFPPLCVREGFYSQITGPWWFTNRLDGEEWESSGNIKLRTRCTWVISGEGQNEYFMLRRARCFRWNTAHSSVYFFLLFLGSKLPCIPRSSSQLAVSDGLFSSQETANRNDRWHLLINVLILDFTWTRNLLV